jgi:LEA14-like dessication related protein
MSQRIQVWSFFILVLATMTSCELQEVDLVELKKVEVERIENEEMFMDVTAVLDNPNSFNIKVKDSDFDLYMENKYIGKANLENTFILESGMQKEYELKVRAQGDRLNVQLLPIMLSAALTGKVSVRLKGSITGKVLFITRSVNVDVTEDVIFKNDSGG